MKRVLVIAPHPDDETLGCGGALLGHRSRGDEVHWLITTGMKKEFGYSADQITCRDKEISDVAGAYGFSSVTETGFPTARLDTIPDAEIIGEISNTFQATSPEIVYLPFPGDAHSDHRAVFDAVSACCKWFRNDHVRQVIACEIPSETGFGMDPTQLVFSPNLFIDISENLERKIQIMSLYKSEMGTFPFPRSEEAIRALAVHRGAEAGCAAAEAFMLLKEVR